MCMYHGYIAPCYLDRMKPPTVLQWMLVLTMLAVGILLAELLIIRYSVPIRHCRTQLCHFLFHPIIVSITL